MTKEEKLADMVAELMRVMLISERTPPENQHVTKYNPLDFHTIGALRVEPGMRSSALAERLGVPPTTTSSVIARLVDRGLVQRRQDAADKRAAALFLTETGAAMAQTIRGQDLRNMGLFLSALTAEEQNEFLRLLAKITDLVAKLDSAEA
ncbi:MAG: MarR family transcriptional regulator [Pseudomonadota bacterium]